MKKYFIFILLLFAIVLSSCKIGVPTVSDVRNVQFVTGKKGELGIEGEIKVNNPNSFGISIKGLKMDVFMNNQPMGRATGGKKIRIKALSDDYHKLYLKTDSKQLTNLGVNVLGLFTGQMSDLKIKGGGKGCVFCFLCKKFEIEHQERIRMNGF